MHQHQTTLSPVRSKKESGDETNDKNIIYIA